MLNNLLASIGIGAARVDTRLADPRVQPGGTLQGEVHLLGGQVDQDVAQIDLALSTPYRKEHDDGHHVVQHELATFRLGSGLTIRAGEQRRIPFTLTVPYHTPMTFGRQQVYLKTGLDIAMALDPRDVDPLMVLPDPVVASIMREVEGMGFKHTPESGLCKYMPMRGMPVPYVQEFELKPTRAFSRDLDELEFIFNIGASGVDVLVQVDRRARGIFGAMEEAMGLDERYHHFFVERARGVRPGEIEQFILRAVQR